MSIKGSPKYRKLSSYTSTSPPDSSAPQITRFERDRCGPFPSVETEAGELYMTSPPRARPVFPQGLFFQLCTIVSFDFAQHLPQ